MIPGGESKRKLGDVWPQLVLSAGVLLVPPLVMTAFVMHFGSPSSQGVGHAGFEVEPHAGATDISVAAGMTLFVAHEVMAESLAYEITKVLLERAP
jgi:hypothetical protein